MEAGALHPRSAALGAIVGHSPLLRLQGDEKLIAHIRGGNHGAFDALVQRYQSRLLAFCRHMLGSTEDAEDVLQEVFAAAFNAICADERPINARPWLYRIARNRCLNHLRRPVPNGQDSMDVFERDGGQTTADTVHKREEFRQIVADVQELPETQRTALLLREIDALSYDHIAEAMDTTVPSVKSLLVRARVSLAEASEARLLTCAEVRLELGEVAEGLTKTTAPVRRHLKTCDRCQTFRGELRRANRALAAIYPLTPLVIAKKLLVTKLGLSAGATTSGSGAGLAGGAAAGATSGAGGLVTATVGTLAGKAAAGFAAAAIVTAGAVEVRQSAEHHHRHPAAAVAAAPAQSFVPRVVASAYEPHTIPPAAPIASRPHPAQARPSAAPARPPARAVAAKPAPPKPQPAVTTPTTTATAPAAASTPTTRTPTTQEGHSTVTLHQAPAAGQGSAAPASQPAAQPAPPAQQGAGSDQSAGTQQGTPPPSGTPAQPGPATPPSGTPAPITTTP